MAQASIDNAMSNYAESSSSAIYSRNDDVMTRALRAEGPLNIVELIHLHRHASPTLDVPSSLGTLTTPVFSSHKESTATKPTSAGTSYPADGFSGNGKAIATYASSLSATHGSGSEAELEQEAIRDHALFGVGDWTADGPNSVQPLKGAARARKRPRLNRRPKQKKPVVIIQQGSPGIAPSEDDHQSAAKQIVPRRGKEAKYLRRRRTEVNHDQLDLAEQGRISEVAPPLKPLSPTRAYILIGVVVTILLTFALSTFAAHHTGKARMACTKGIIFAGTVLISCFTVLAMVIARRALQEALLTGLLESLVGFVLVIEISDFM